MANPLNFFLNVETNEYELASLTEQSILETIQRGTDTNGGVIFVNSIFKDTTPASISQVSFEDATATKLAGTNNLEKARVARYSFTIKEQDEEFSGIDKYMYYAFEEKL